MFPIPCRQALQYKGHRLRCFPLRLHVGFAAAVCFGLVGFISLHSSLDAHAQQVAILQHHQGQPSYSVTDRPVVPLRTNGSHVLDARGSKVRLNCVNWRGLENNDVIRGLDVKPLSYLVHTTADLGFNCVRLAFSLEMVLQNATRVRDTRSVAANPELGNHSPLAILDLCVEALTLEGIMVILNVHTLASMGCCAIDDADGLWYSTHTIKGMKQFSELQFLAGLAQMTRRYRSNPLVVAFDLKNEIRPDWAAAPPVTPTWGGGDVATDWYLAARQASLRVLGENPDMVLIVSGMHFSQYLCDVPKHPLHLDPLLQGRVIYTIHNYRWFSIPSVAVKFVRRHGMVFAGFNCAYTLVVLAGRVVSRVLYKSIWQREHTSTFKLHSAVASCFIFVALTSCLVFCYFKLYGCGFWATVFRLISFGLLWLFTGWSLLLLLHLAGIKANALDRQSHGTQFFSSWFVLALGLQAVELALIFYVLQTFGSDGTFESEMDASWGFLGSCFSADPARSAPVWISEFGLGVHLEHDELAWYDWFWRFYKERDFAGFAYWCLIGSTMSILDGATGDLRHATWQEAALKPLREHMAHWRQEVCVGMK